MEFFSRFYSIWYHFYGGTLCQKGAQRWAPNESFKCHALQCHDGLAEISHPKRAFAFALASNGKDWNGRTERWTASFAPAFLFDFEPFPKSRHRPDDGCANHGANCLNSFR